MPRRIVVCILLLIAMLASFFGVGILSQSKAKAAILTTIPANISWPVRGTDGNWTIENGYNNCSLSSIPDPNDPYDHGHCNGHGNPSQFYGFDLILNGNQDAKGKDVLAPVDGTIAYHTDLGSLGISLGIKVNGTTSNGTALYVSLVHVENVSWDGVKGHKLGDIKYQSDNTHLHWNLFQASATNADVNRIPIPFMNDTGNLYHGYDAHIQGCGDYIPNQSVNQFSSNTTISCGLESYGYWAGPSPTGTDSSPIHLYGSPAARQIQLGYSTGTTKQQKADFWQCQVGSDQSCAQNQWQWIGSEKIATGSSQEGFTQSNGSWYGFQQFTLNGPGYIAVDVQTPDSVWHESENGIRALCVILPDGSKHCPNTTTVTYHDGSVHSPGLGGGGDLSPTPTPTPSPNDGVKVCSGANYSGTCSVFTYTGDNGSVQSLGSLSLNQDSLQFLGSYANAYDVVLCLKAGCPSSDREIQHDDPNFATSLTKNQYVAIRIVKNAPPVSNPTDGVQVFQNGNFSGPSQTFTYDGNNGTCYKFNSDLYKHQDSLKFLGSYIGQFDAVFSGKDDCSTGDSEDFSDKSDFGLAKNQYATIRLVILHPHTPPNAPDSPTPADGTTLPSGTTSLGMSWNGSDTSIIHIWSDSGWNYQNGWSGNGIGFGNLGDGTYHWQVITANAYGESPWSPVWTFIVPSAGPPTPLPSGSVKEGGLNLDAYCQSINQPVSGVINGIWYCGNGTVALDLTKACQWQYSDPSSFSFQEEANNPYAWNCYTFPTPPAVASSNYTVMEGQAQTDTITTSHTGTKSLSVTASNLPSFASFKDNSNGTGTVTFNPTIGNAGNYTFTVTASDGQLSGSGTFTINVNPQLWKITGSLKTARFSAASVVLPNGKVLIVGGSSANNTALSSAELYDPKTGIWTSTGSLKFARINPLAILLKTGKVLVTGGFTQYVVSTSELYDPSTGKWSQTGSLVNGSQTSTATLLQSGKVLLVQRGNAELYDPNTGKWTNTNSVVVSRLFNTAVLLENGKVLVAAGADSKGHDLSSSELYNPTTNSWTASGTLPKMVDYSNGVLLPNGKVLLVALTTTPYSLIVSMVYDPTTGKWSDTSELNHTGRYGSSLVVLPNGKPLIAGGQSFVSGENNATTAEVYDSSTDKWTYTNSLTVGRAYHQTILLQDGRVLVTGGIDASNKTVSSSELYG